MFYYLFNCQENALGSVTNGKYATLPTSDEFFDNYLCGMYDKQAIGRMRSYIPSIFARPIFFYHAFKDKDHPIHKHVVAQWRGLLGFFALQKNLSGFSFNVVQEKIDFTNIHTSNTPFKKMLANNLPNGLWNEMYLVYVDCESRRSLVGATSPWTMFFTPAQPTICPVITWQDEQGCLKDPTCCLAPRSTEITILYNWINLVCAKHDEWGATNDIATTVFEELKNWAEELLPLISTTSINNTGQETGNLISQNPYQFFINPFVKVL